MYPPHLLMKLWCPLINGYKKLQFIVWSVSVETSKHLNKIHHDGNVVDFEPKKRVLNEILLLTKDSFVKWWMQNSKKSNWMMIEWDCLKLSYGVLNFSKNQHQFCWYLFAFLFVSLVGNFAARKYFADIIFLISDYIFQWTTQ